MCTFQRMSYLTAFRRPISQAYIWHQNTGFTERSDSFLYSFLPASKENVEINRVKFMVEVDCQSFSGVPFKKKKKYRHITLARDYTLITFSKADMLQTCRYFTYFVWHKGTKFCPYYLCFQLAVQIFIQFYSGEGIYIL